MVNRPWLNCGSFTSFGSAFDGANTSDEAFLAEDMRTWAVLDRTGMKQRPIQMRELWTAAASTGPYTTTAHCHVAANAAYNLCAVPAQARNDMPNENLTLVAGVAKAAGVPTDALRKQAPILASSQEHISRAGKDKVACHATSRCPFDAPQSNQMNNKHKDPESRSEPLRCGW